MTLTKTLRSLAPERTLKCTISVVAAWIAYNRDSHVAAFRYLLAMNVRFEPNFVVRMPSTSAQTVPSWTWRPGEPTTQPGPSSPSPAMQTWTGVSDGAHSTFEDRSEFAAASSQVTQSRAAVVVPMTR